MYLIQFKKKTCLRLGFELEEIKITLLGGFFEYGHYWWEKKPTPLPSVVITGWTYPKPDIEILDQDWNYLK